jgi:hypothetical protein
MQFVKFGKLKTVQPAGGWTPESFPGIFDWVKFDDKTKLFTNSSETTNVENNNDPIIKARDIISDSLYQSGSQTPAGSPIWKDAAIDNAYFSGDDFIKSSGTNMLDYYNNTGNSAAFFVVNMAVANFNTLWNYGRNLNNANSIWLDCYTQGRFDLKVAGTTKQFYPSGGVTQGILCGILIELKTTTNQVLLNFNSAGVNFRQAQGLTSAAIGGSGTYYNTLGTSPNRAADITANLYECGFINGSLTSADIDSWEEYLADVYGIV